MLKTWWLSVVEFLRRVFGLDELEDFDDEISAEPEPEPVKADIVSVYPKGWKQKRKLPLKILMENRGKNRKRRRYEEKGQRNRNQSTLFFSPRANQLKGGIKWDKKRRFAADV